MPHGERALSRIEKLYLFGEILTVYARARWLLGRRDLPDALRELRQGGDRAGLPAPQHHGHASPAAEWREVALALRIGRVVVRALEALPTDSRCLIRSLVTVGLLEQRGVASTLIIGVRACPSFEAHAWVENHGHPVLPTDSELYDRLVEL